MHARGLCLDAQTAVEIDEATAKADKLMNELIKNPKVLDALLESIERLKIHLFILSRPYKK